MWGGGKQQYKGVKGGKGRAGGRGGGKGGKGAGRGSGRGKGAAGADPYADGAAGDAGLAKAFAAKPDAHLSKQGLRASIAPCGPLYLNGAQSELDWLDPTSVASTRDKTNTEAMARMGMWVSMVSGTVEAGADVLQKVFGDGGEAIAGPILAALDTPEGQAFLGSARYLNVKNKPPRGHDLTGHSLQAFVEFLAKSDPDLHRQFSTLYVASANMLLFSAHMIEAMALAAHPAKWADGVDRDTHPPEVADWKADPTTAHKLVSALRAAFEARLVEEREYGHQPEPRWDMFSDGAGEAAGGGGGGLRMGAYSDEEPAAAAPPARAARRAAPKAPTAGPARGAPPASAAHGARPKKSARRPQGRPIPTGTAPERAAAAGTAVRTAAPVALGRQQSAPPAATAGPAGAPASRLSLGRKEREATGGLVLGQPPAPAAVRPATAAGPGARPGDGARGAAGRGSALRLGGTSAGSQAAPPAPRGGVAAESKKAGRRSADLATQMGEAAKRQRQGAERRALRDRAGGGDAEEPERAAEEPERAAGALPLEDPRDDLEGEESSNDIGEEGGESEEEPEEEEGSDPDGSGEDHGDVSESGFPDEDTAVNLALIWGPEEIEAAEKTMGEWKTALDAGRKRVVTWAAVTQWMGEVPDEVKAALPGFAMAEEKTADTDRLHPPVAREIVEALSKDVAFMASVVSASRGALGASGAAPADGDAPGETSTPVGGDTGAAGSPGMAAPPGDADEDE